MDLKEEGSMRLEQVDWQLCSSVQPCSVLGENFEIDTF